MAIVRVFRTVCKAGTQAIRISRLLTIFAATLIACRAVAADKPVMLPQDHDYQVILRNHIGSLTVKDFEVPLQSIEFREQWFRDDESLHRMWVLAQSFPETIGLMIAPDNFVLRTIESPDGIRIRPGQRGDGNGGIGVAPEDTAWWSTWDHRANPYRGSHEVRNRAFVIAAVDMIMLDKLHESGTDWVKNARRSDFLGGALSWLAQVYSVVRGDLPEKVQVAYETGLEKFVDRLIEWGPTSVNDNIDTKALVAAAYLELALRDGRLVEKMRAYSKRALERLHPSGIIRDAGGMEASYNGCALFNVAWATSVAPRPEFVAALRQMSDIKSHLALPEPDLANFWGPSHFSTRTSLDSANDQWAFPQRDIAIAMHADEALYLMFGGDHGRPPGWAAPSRTAMVREITSAVDRVNAGLKPSPDRFRTWGVTLWATGKVNFAYDHYTPGFHTLLSRLRAERNPAALPPMVRPGETFIRVFPSKDKPNVAEADRDAFLIARFPTYGAVVYTGPIGWHSYMNFAGGCLSAFWTPGSGSVVLGRNGNPVEPEKTRQSWADWRVWPTHALSGQTASGDAFSSARIRRRVATVECEAGRHAATVSFSGPIGKQHDESRAAQNGCIRGDVRYQRTMGLGPRGIAIETGIQSNGKDQVTELCEILPLLLREEKRQTPTQERPDLGVAHRVLFQVDDRVIEPGDGFVQGVTAVHIERFFDGVTVRFEEPRRVRLGEVWTDSYQTAMSVRNLIIDLLDGKQGSVPLPTVAIRYRIEPKVSPTP